MQWKIVGVYNAQADTWRILLRVQKNGMSQVPPMAFELPPDTAEEFFKTISVYNSSFRVNVSAPLPDSVVRILNHFSNSRGKK